MQLCKFQLESGVVHVGLVENKKIHQLDLDRVGEVNSLADLLHANDPIGLAHALIEKDAPPLPIAEAKLLPPIDGQEVWAAGVTYERSKIARKKESKRAASHYDKVYTAARPELFFKATPHRVSGPDSPVRIRADSKWSVPEPELALVLSPQLELLGYTIGNDMSARDIEGENPLYLPQAKVYDQNCSLGPVITLAEDMPPKDKISIKMTIKRGRKKAFDGSTKISKMARSFEDLIAWLGRDNSFPSGSFLLTGTGIVPPDEFALEPGDQIKIDITGIGTLTNIVEQE